MGAYGRYTRVREARTWVWKSYTEDFELSLRLLEWCLPSFSHAGAEHVQTVVVVYSYFLYCNCNTVTSKLVLKHGDGQR